MKFTAKVKTDTGEWIDIPKEVLVTNHGNVFNTKNWYTFQCPHCYRSVSCGVQICSCGGEIMYTAEEVKGNEGRYIHATERYCW